MLRSVLSLSVALALTACSPQNSSTEQQSQSAATEEAQQQLSSGVIKENMDLTVDPGDDFFRYVNGNWFDNFENLTRLEGLNRKPQILKIQYFKFPQSL